MYTIIKNKIYCTKANVKYPNVDMNKFNEYSTKDLVWLPVFLDKKYLLFTKLL